MSLIWPELEVDTVYINRYKSDDKQTLGEMVYKGKVVAKTLELAWRNNDRRVSCIPAGIYSVVRRYTSKYGNHFHILNVKDRDMILIHKGNFHFHSLGCIIVGKDHVDLNYDGYKDVTSSKDKMIELNRLLPIEFDLKIT
jgi:hypothetical protein